MINGSNFPHHDTLIQTLESIIKRSILDYKHFESSNLWNKSIIHFSEATTEYIKNEIKKLNKKLNASKKDTFKNILPKCMLETLVAPQPILLNIWNEGIFKDCAYPDKLKLPDISPEYKK